MIDWIFTNLIGPNSQWFWCMLTCFALTVSLVLIYGQVRLQRQANLLHTLGEMDKRWNSEKMLLARKGACTKYLNDQLGIDAELAQILGFFEDVAVYLERKVFDIGAVWDKYSYYIEHYWAMYQPHIQKFRTETRDQTWYENFDKMFEEVKKHALKRWIVCGSKTKADIDIFVIGEIGLIPEKDEYLNKAALSH